VTPTFWRKVWYRVLLVASATLVGFWPLGWFSYQIADPRDGTIILFHLWTAGVGASGVLGVFVMVGAVRGRQLGTDPFQMLGQILTVLHGAGIVVGAILALLRSAIPLVSWYGIVAVGTVISLRAAWTAGGDAPAAAGRAGAPATRPR